ncbi:MAG: DUF6056 family protein [Clostridium sp.]|nr:DUF6056 family protein [Clostridium sp.]
MKLKKITVVSIIIFFLLMLPVFYLSFINRASGDDYGYGIYTRGAWVSSHSFAALGRAIGQTIKQYYSGWQGTWFSVLVFSLQPEVFSDKAYVLVAFLMLFLWIGSTFYLFYEILCKSLGLNKWEYLLISVWFLIINIEFIPSTKSAIYWFNGCAHYMLPFAMCQIAAVWLIRYGKTYKKSTFIGIAVFMTLLGGSNYQAALFALIAACYTIAAVWFLKKEKRILTLLIPVCMELIGLIISMKAPGNKVRGGEEFGFSVSKGAETIAKSFVYGLKDLKMYLQERPLIFAGLILLFVIFVVIFCNKKEVVNFRYSLILSAMLFCLYSAMQAPAIYAGVDVSGGVYNMNFQMFLLTASGMLLIIAGNLVKLARNKGGEAAVKTLWKSSLICGLFLSLVLVAVFRSNIKTSTSYICLRYIVSGEAGDYREQMELQTRLMEEEEVENVVVPFINDVQGPLMQMPVTEDVSAWTNTVTAGFYGKDSVVAMERPKWMELYGEE